MYINQFSVVVFKRQHYVFHILLAALLSVNFQSCIFHPCNFVRHFPVLQFPLPEISLSVISLSCKFSPPPFCCVFICELVLYWIFLLLRYYTQCLLSEHQYT